MGLGVSLITKPLAHTSFFYGCFCPELVTQTPHSSKSFAWTLLGPCLHFLPEFQLGCRVEDPQLSLEVGKVGLHPWGECHVDSTIGAREVHPGREVPKGRQS